MFKIMNQIFDKLERRLCYKIERSIIESINLKEVLKKCLEESEKCIREGVTNGGRTLK